MKLKISIYPSVRANLLYPFQCETPCIKAGKLALRPWLSCPYNENTLMDLPSSVGVGGKTCKQTTGIFLHFAFADRVWEYFDLNFFPAGCLRICYSVRPQYWAKKMQFPWKQTVRQILPPRLKVIFNREQIGLP